MNYSMTEAETREIDSVVEQMINNANTMPKAE